MSPSSATAYRVKKIYGRGVFEKWLLLLNGFQLSCPQEEIVLRQILHKEKLALSFIQPKVLEKRSLLKPSPPTISKQRHILPHKFYNEAESLFQKVRFPDRSTLQLLAKKYNVSYEKIQQYFYNRRAREKRCSDNRSRLLNSAIIEDGMMGSLAGTDELPMDTTNEPKFIELKTVDWSMDWASSNQTPLFKGGNE